MFVHLDETRESKMSEIDMILAQRKKKIKRRKKSGDSILTNDDFIMDFLKSMQEAAQEDRELNEKQQTAINKLKLLPTLQKQLLKQNSLHLFVAILFILWAYPTPFLLVRLILSLPDIQRHIYVILIRSPEYVNLNCFEIIFLLL